MSRPSTSSLLLYCKDVDARDKPGHDGWARTSSGKQEPDGSDRRPYQPPFWYPRGARPRLVHGWRGRGGRDRRSLRLRQEYAIVDPGRAAAPERGLGAIARRAAARQPQSADVCVSGFCALALVHGRTQLEI